MRIQAAKAAEQRGQWEVPSHAEFGKTIPNSTNSGRHGGRTER
ncbi:hypothetical protein [Clostridium sp. chh4-2]|nr:hypothetical protein [Clostridium sp. chh4-2]